LPNDKARLRGRDSSRDYNLILARPVLLDGDDDYPDDVSGLFKSVGFESGLVL
jgi:hypothetical protein